MPPAVYVRPPTPEYGFTKGQRWQLERKTASTVNVAREASLAFLEADANNDGKLTYVEFKDAIGRLRSRTGSIDTIDAKDEQALRELFDSIDGNKNGFVEMDEYFLWTIDMSTKQGCGLESLFKKYDTTGEGLLDANEFALAVEDLGFSATFAHDLFVDLDDDNSGAVSYSEITQTLKARVGELGADSKKLLTSLAFHDSHAWNAAQKVDVRTGRRLLKASAPAADGPPSDDVLQALKATQASTASELKGPDAESLRKQLQELLAANAMRDSDLYNLLTMPLVRGDPSQPLTKHLFVRGIQELGYSGAPGMLVNLFKRIDSDKTGIIGFAELREWMTGKMRRTTRARETHLLYGLKGVTLRDIKWTPKRLRREMVRMLQRAELAPIDMVRAWDPNNDMTFSKQEFLVMMKKIIYLSGLAAEASAATALSQQKAELKATAGTDGEIKWGLAKIGQTEGLIDGSAIFKQQKATTSIAADFNPELFKKNAAETEADQLMVEEMKLSSVDKLARNLAATKLQASARGRKIRKTMSRKEGDQLWYQKIKPAVLKLFKEIAGDDGVMDVQEFVRWLNGIWKREKKRLKLGAADVSSDEEDEEVVFGDDGGVQAMRQTRRPSTDQLEEKAATPAKKTAAQETEEGAAKEAAKPFDPNALMSSYLRALQAASLTEAPKVGSGAPRVSRAASPGTAMRDKEETGRLAHARPVRHLLTPPAAHGSASAGPRQGPRSAPMRPHTASGGPRKDAPKDVLMSHWRDLPLPSSAKARSGRAQSAASFSKQAMGAAGQAAHLEGQAANREVFDLGGAPQRQRNSFHGAGRRDGARITLTLPEVSPRFYALRSCVSGLEETVRRVQDSLDVINANRSSER